MTKKQYINEIANRTCLPHKYKKKIIKDFTQEFDSMIAQGYSEDEVIKSMGDADVIAADIYESYISNEEISRPFIEYKSNKTVFGMPLIHIVKAKRQSYIRGISDDRNRYMRVPTAKGFIAIGRRAKGIIAIGNLSCGIISIGNLSIGLISVANIGLGLLSLGNLVLGLLLSLGNVAIGTFSVANGAIAYASLGNVAFGKYAIAHIAYGYQCLNLDMQGNIQMGQKIIDFFSNAPAFVQSFFHMGITLIENLNWLLISLGISIILAIISGIVIGNWLEAKIRK